MHFVWWRLCHSEGKNEFLPRFLSLNCTRTANMVKKNLVVKLMNYLCSTGGCMACIRWSCIIDSKEWKEALGKNRDHIKLLISSSHLWWKHVAVVSERDEKKKIRHLFFLDSCCHSREVSKVGCILEGKLWLCEILMKRDKKAVRAGLSNATSFLPRSLPFSLLFCLSLIHSSLFSVLWKSGCWFAPSS